MAESRKAKNRVIAGGVMLPVAGGAFVLGLVDAASYANTLAMSLIVTAGVLTGVLVFLSLNIWRLASEDCGVAPNFACGLGFALSPLLGMLVLLELLRDGRQLPPYLSSIELSPLASTGFITIGMCLTLMGMGLIAYDLIRISANRATAEVDPSEPENAPERRRHYWPLNRLAPELDLFQTDKQATEALNRAGSRVRMVVCLVIAAPLLSLAMNLLGVAWLNTWASTIMMPLAFATVAVYLCLRRETYRRSIREDLRKIGLPICIQCGYDLREQTQPRCPECGSPIDAGWVHPDFRPDKHRKRASKTGLSQE